MDLFSTIAKAEAGDDYFDFAEAFLANGAAPSSVSTTYTITNNSGSSNPRDEGGSITFTISDGNSTSASKIYVATTNATAVAGKDYKGITKQEVAFGTGDSTKTVKVNLYEDAESDDNENFYLELF